MKKILLATLLMISGATYAQNVGIGTNKPDESAILDLHSTKKGFLLPRLNEKQRMLIPAPAEGLIVYQTDSNQGIYIYQSGKWNNISSSTSSASTRFQNANAVGTLTANYLTMGNADGDVVSSGPYYDPSTGFLGLGTTTPQGKLDVQGVLALKSGVFDGGGIKFSYTDVDGTEIDSTSRSWKMVNDYFEYGDFGFFQSKSKYVDGVANSDSRMYISRQGYVGIGTTYPIAKFQVNGTTYLNGNTQIAGITRIKSGWFGLGGMQFDAAADDNSRSWKMINDFNGFGDFGFFQSNSATGTTYDAKFYIAADGKVGFGTTAPTKKLDVAGGIKQSEVTSKILKADDSGNLVGAAITEATAESSNIVKIDSKSAGYLAIGDFTGNALTSFPTGYRLVVQDGIISEKMNLALKSSASWADYVFEPTYQLMPLNEVEDYVKENKHLPNVPSADDMVSTGLDVAQTSKMFMEKIEELTLYMIELKKEVEALKAENANLRK